MGKKRGKNEQFSISIEIIVLFLTFCSLVTAAGPAAAAEKLTYRLKWLFNTSVVGDLYADDHGFFSEEGLTVLVKAGGPEKDAIKELELGYADFGVASADQVIRALSKGASVVVIAQLFQENPLQWIYRAADLKIETLKDLQGKTIGITYGGNDETIMRTLLTKAHLTENDVNLFSVRYDYTPFFQGKVPIWPIYRNTQGIFIAQKLHDAGERIAFFKPADFGVKFVANSIVTSEEMIKDHPDTVYKFTRALKKAWKIALAPENHSKAVATLQRFDKDTTTDILAKQLAITRTFIQPSPAIAIGTLDKDAWQQTEKIMLEQKLISEPVFVEKVLQQY